MNTDGASPTNARHGLTGGTVAAASTACDPYQTLDDLMVVVEALCPPWPPRDLFKGHDILL